MDKKVKISKAVYNRERYNKVIDRSFKEFVEETPEEDLDTVNELFRLYEKLFYSIPIKGEERSHEYILRRSSEIADYEKTTEDIQPLLDEIANLRRQLLNANQQNIELQNEIAKG